jgi:hypothetical protein
MQTSGVGFCAGGATGFVVFGAAVDAGCCFFLPFFPPPLVAAFPPHRDLVFTLFLPQNVRFLTLFFFVDQAYI